MSTPTPAIVTESAARALPRPALLLLCVAYLLPGFLGRSPWKSADVTAFGLMREMALGQTSWLAPRWLGHEGGADALLPYWLGAAAIRALPMLDAALAVQLPFIALLALTMAATWYAAYHLARDERAQPVAFAFGGEARPVDYARAMADGTLLALLACLGLAQLAHETTPTLAQLAMAALTLYGLAALRTRPRRALPALLLSGPGLALSGAPSVAVLLLLAGLLLGWREREGQDWPRERLLAAVLGVLLVTTVAALASGLWAWRIEAWIRQPRALVDFGRLLLWFTWPAWPLALWTLWRWRRQWRHPHVALPVWLALVPLAAASVTATADRALLPGLPALAVLAAFALPTLQRSVSALIDWFTLLFFSGCAFVIWVIWIAMMTGVPRTPAANVARLAPGFEPVFSALALSIAAAATLLWLWVVRWRVGRHRAALWKSLVLPSGGAVLCWLLLMTLWLPLLDHARSYGPLARELEARMPEGGCVEIAGLKRAQISGLTHHARFELRAGTAAQGCRWLLGDRERLAATGTRPDETLWTEVATVRRPGDRDEDVVLYRRRAP